MAILIFLLKSWLESILKTLRILFKQFRKSHSLILQLVVLVWAVQMVILPLKLNAQQVSSSVLNGFGGSASIQGQTYDSSLGELAISTIQAGGYIITQGFLQPIDLKVACGDVVLKSFPNPVVSEITIFAEGCDVEVASVKTYDLFGKLVHEGNTMNNKISFSSIGVGVYLVRAYTKNNQVVGVVKILKTTI